MADDSIISLLQELNKQIAAQGIVSVATSSGSNASVINLALTQNQTTQLSLTSFYVSYAKIAIAGNSGNLNEVNIVTSSNATVGYPIFQAAIYVGVNSTSAFTNSYLEVHNTDLSSLYAYTTVSGLTLGIYLEQPGSISPLSAAMTAATATILAGPGGKATTTIQQTTTTPPPTPTPIPTPTPTPTPSKGGGGPPSHQM